MHIILLQNQIYSFVANSAKYSHLRKKRCKYGKMLELVGQSEKKANENATISKSSDLIQSKHADCGVHIVDIFGRKVHKHIVQNWTNLQRRPSVNCLCTSW